MDLPFGDRLHSGASWAGTQELTKMEGERNEGKGNSTHPASPLEDFVSNLATKVNMFVAQGQSKPAEPQDFIKMEGGEGAPRDDVGLTQSSDSLANHEPPSLERRVSKADYHACTPVK